MTDEPQILSTTTASSPTPIADSIPSPETGPVPAATPEQAVAAEAPQDPGPVQAESPAQWNPDLSAITSANGDPHPWAHLLHEMIGHTTGKWIDEESLEGWLEAFASQVTTATFKSALFEVANTQLPATPKGDPAILLLQLRDEIAQSFKHSAGL